MARSFYFSLLKSQGEKNRFVFLLFFCRRSSLLYLLFLKKNFYLIERIYRFFLSARSSAFRLAGIFGFLRINWSIFCSVGRMICRIIWYFFSGVVSGSSWLSRRRVSSSIFCFCSAGISQWRAWLRRLSGSAFVRSCMK